jgi:hypothetical protein
MTTPSLETRVTKLEGGLNDMHIRVSTLEKSDEVYLPLMQKVASSFHFLEWFVKIGTPIALALLSAIVTALLKSKWHIG